MTTVNRDDSSPVSNCTGSVDPRFLKTAEWLSRLVFFSLALSLWAAQQSKGIVRRSLGLTESAVAASILAKKSIMANGQSHRDPHNI